MSGSKGLQRYVPRILQDSGMIASSEVAHYTHLKLVQYVKADDIDAALRRAKVDVLEDLSNLLTYSRFNSYEQRMCERGCGLTKEGRIGASIGLAWALGELDALATLQKGRT